MGFNHYYLISMCLNFNISNLPNTRVGKTGRRVRSILENTHPSDRMTKPKYYFKQKKYAFAKLSYRHKKECLLETLSSRTNRNKSP